MTLENPSRRHLAAEMLDGNEKASSGAMKQCDLWIFNTDPDQVAGYWLKPKLSPLSAVDGRRFGNGKTTPWAVGCGKYAPYRGAMLTINFGQPAEFATNTDSRRPHLYNRWDMRPQRG